MIKFTMGASDNKKTHRRKLKRTGKSNGIFSSSSRTGGLRNPKPGSFNEQYVPFEGMKTSQCANQAYFPQLSPYKDCEGRLRSDCMKTGTEEMTEGDRTSCSVNEDLIGPLKPTLDADRCFLCHCQRSEASRVSSDDSSNMDSQESAVNAQLTLWICRDCRQIMEEEEAKKINAIQQSSSALQTSAPSQSSASGGSAAAGTVVTVSAPSAAASGDNCGCESCVERRYIQAEMQDNELLGCLSDVKDFIQKLFHSHEYLHITRNDISCTEQTQQENQPAVCTSEDQRAGIQSETGLGDNDEQHISKDASNEEVCKSNVSDETAENLPESQECQADDLGETKNSEDSGVCDNSDQAISEELECAGLVEDEGLPSGKQETRTGKNVAREVEQLDDILTDMNVQRIKTYVIRLCRRDPHELFKLLDILLNQYIVNCRERLIRRLPFCCQHRVEDCCESRSTGETSDNSAAGSTAESSTVIQHTAEVSLSTSSKQRNRGKDSCGKDSSVLDGAEVPTSAESACSFVAYLLDEYTATLDIAEKLSSFLHPLEDEHLCKFGLTIDRLHRLLFCEIIYTKLRPHTVVFESLLSNSELLEKFGEFQQQMKEMSAISHQCHALILKYNAEQTRDAVGQKTITEEEWMQMNSVGLLSEEDSGKTSSTNRRLQEVMMESMWQMLQERDLAMNSQQSSANCPGFDSQCCPCEECNLARMMTEGLSYADVTDDTDDRQIIFPDQLEYIDNASKLQYRLDGAGETHCTSDSYGSLHPNNIYVPCYDEDQYRFSEREMLGEELGYDCDMRIVDHRTYRDSVSGLKLFSRAHGPVPSPAYSSQTSLTSVETQNSSLEKVSAQSKGEKPVRSSSVVGQKNLMSPEKIGEAQLRSTQSSPGCVLRPATGSSRAAAPTAVPAAATSSSGPSGTGDKIVTSKKCSSQLSDAKLETSSDQKSFKSPGYTKTRVRSSEANRRSLTSSPEPESTEVSTCKESASRTSMDGAIVKLSESVSNVSLCDMSDGNEGDVEDDDDDDDDEDYDDDDDEEDDDEYEDDDEEEEDDNNDVKPDAVAELSESGTDRAQSRPSKNGARKQLFERIPAHHFDVKCPCPYCKSHRQQQYMYARQQEQLYWNQQQQKQLQWQLQWQHDQAIFPFDFSHHLQDIASQYQIQPNSEQQLLSLSNTSSQSCVNNALLGSKAGSNIGFSCPVIQGAFPAHSVIVNTAQAVTQNGLPVTSSPSTKNSVTESGNQALPLLASGTVNSGNTAASSAASSSAGFANIRFSPFTKSSAVVPLSGCSTAAVSLNNASESVLMSKGGTSVPNEVFKIKPQFPGSPSFTLSSSTSSSQLAVPHSSAFSPASGPGSSSGESSDLSSVEKRIGAISVRGGTPVSNVLMAAKPVCATVGMCNVINTPALLSFNAGTATDSHGGNTKPLGAASMPVLQQAVIRLPAAAVNLALSNDRLVESGHCEYSGSLTGGGQVLSGDNTAGYAVPASFSSAFQPVFYQTTNDVSLGTQSQQASFQYPMLTSLFSQRPDLFQSTAWSNSQANGVSLLPAFTSSQHTSSGNAESMLAEIHGTGHTACSNAPPNLFDGSKVGKLTGVSSNSGTACTKQFSYSGMTVDLNAGNAFSGFSSTNWGHSLPPPTLSGIRFTAPLLSSAPTSAPPTLPQASQQGSSQLVAGHSNRGFFSSTAGSTVVPSSAGMFQAAPAMNTPANTANKATDNKKQMVMSNPHAALKIAGNSAMNLKNTTPINRPTVMGRLEPGDGCTNKAMAGVRGQHGDEHCSGQHHCGRECYYDDDDDDDEDEDDCSGEEEEETEGDSSTSPAPKGKYCECWHCEFFGHSSPPTAPTSKNYAEMRDRLRLRLKKKNDCVHSGTTTRNESAPMVMPSTTETPVVPVPLASACTKPVPAVCVPAQPSQPKPQKKVPRAVRSTPLIAVTSSSSSGAQASAVRGIDDLDELVRYITGEDKESNDNKQSSKAAKRARQKLRKEQEEQQKAAVKSGKSAAGKFSASKPEFLKSMKPQTNSADTSNGAKKSAENKNKKEENQDAASNDASLDGLDIDTIDFLNGASPLLRSELARNKALQQLMIQAASQHQFHRRQQQQQQQQDQQQLHRQQLQEQQLIQQQLQQQLEQQLQKHQQSSVQQLNQQQLQDKLQQKKSGDRQNVERIQLNQQREMQKLQHQKLLGKKFLAETEQLKEVLKAKTSEKETPSGKDLRENADKHRETKTFEKQFKTVNFVQNSVKQANISVPDKTLMQRRAEVKPQRTEISPKGKGKVSNPNGSSAKNSAGLSNGDKNEIKKQTSPVLTEQKVTNPTDKVKNHVTSSNAASKGLNENAVKAKQTELVINGNGYSDISGKGKETKDSKLSRKNVTVASSKMQNGIAKNEQAKDSGKIDNKIFVNSNCVNAVAADRQVSQCKLNEKASIRLMNGSVSSTIRGELNNSGVSRSSASLKPTAQMKDEGNKNPPIKKPVTGTFESSNGVSSVQGQANSKVIQTGSTINSTVKKDAKGVDDRAKHAAGTAAQTQKQKATDDMKTDSVTVKQKSEKAATCRGDKDDFGDARERRVVADSDRVGVNRSVSDPRLMKAEAVERNGRVAVNGICEPARNESVNVISQIAFASPSRDTSQRAKRNKKKNKTKDVSVDEIFLPRNTDGTAQVVDGVEKEIEEFKRFCLNSTVTGNREKLQVNMNLKDIFAKKK